MATKIKSSSEKKVRGMLTEKDVVLNDPEVARIRQDFPLLRDNPDLVYLDNAATAQKLKSIRCR